MGGERGARKWYMARRGLGEGVREMILKSDVHGRHCMLSYLSSLPIQFYVVWILRLINFTIELTDYMMLLYLQGVTINMLFIQSLILKLII